MAKVLLNRGANVNHVNSYKRTAMHYASGNGHYEVVKLLLARDANVNIIVDKFNKTPLHYAKEIGHQDIIRALENICIQTKMLPLELEGEECCICLSEEPLQKKESAEKVGQLSCGHPVHPTCIKTWNKRSSTCPICRRQLLLDF